MKKSDYKKGLVQRLMERDEHLCLSLEQAEQLVEYITEYEEEVKMLPPIVEGSTPVQETEDGIVFVQPWRWEDE